MNSGFVCSHYVSKALFGERNQMAALNQNALNRGFTVHHVCEDRLID